MSRNLFTVLLTQTQLVFNQSALKLALVAVAALYAVEAGYSPEFLTSLAAFIMIVPYVVLAPTAGWVSDRFSKTAVLRWTMGGQVVSTLLLAGGFFMENFWLVNAGALIFAVNAAIFSPAKQGIMKEIVGSARLGYAVGLLEMTTILALLLGALGGGAVIDYFVLKTDSSWVGGFGLCMILLVPALGSWGGIFALDRMPSQGRGLAFRPALLWGHGIQLKKLWRQRALRLAASGITYFYLLAAVAFLTLAEAGRDIAGGGAGAATRTGIFLICMGGGIAAGAAVATVVSRHRIELGLVPGGALIIAASLAILGWVPLDGAGFIAGLVLLGVGGAFFVVPLNAHLQNEAPNRQRGTVLAATNLLVNMGVLAATAIYYLLSATLDLTPREQFLFLSLPTLALTLWVTFVLREGVVRFLGAFAMSVVYRVKPLHLERLPDGPVLLLPNHVNWIDAVILQLACPRPIRFMVFANVYNRFGVKFLFQLLQAIPIDRDRTKLALTEACERLRQGEVVCLFPEGETPRSSQLTRLRRGFRTLVRMAQCPVQPVWLDLQFQPGLSAAHTSWLFWRFPMPVRVAFGEPLPPTEAHPGKIQEMLLRLDRDCFEENEFLDGHLGVACMRSLRLHPFRPCVIDSRRGGAVGGRGVLARAMALAARLRLDEPRRIGILLPPGADAVYANLGVVLADKVPVNLDPSWGARELEKALAGVKKILTTAEVRSGIAEFPDSVQTLHIDEVLKGMRREILFFRGAVAALPLAWLGRLIGLRDSGGRREAVLVFKKRGAGQLGGLALSHRNVLANISQIRPLLRLGERDRVLASLPYSRGFGSITALWYPLVEGTPMITHRAPLDAAGGGVLIRRYKATLLLGAPGIMRAYLRQADLRDMKPLRLAVVGGGPLPGGLARAFEDRFELPLIDGYGLAEATAVASLNLAEPAPQPGRAAADKPRPGKPGSVGRLVPGLAARIVEPASGVPLPLDQVGELCLSGPNLVDTPPEDGAVIEDPGGEKWLRTGDLASFDADGFLFLHGRHAVRGKKVDGPGE